MDIRLVVFDVGRTLMEYKDMPNSWQEFYPAAIRNIKDALGLDVSEEELNESLEIFKSYSPRLHYRENDYTPEHIFSDVIKNWRCKPDIQDVIKAFFDSMDLKSYIYPETVHVLRNLKMYGVKRCALSDVATGMPDEMHKSYFKELLPHLDMYVSSVSCGFRKPNPKGLEEISAKFGIPKEEMLMVGDEKKDIEVAKRFGCKSVLIDRYGEGGDYGQDYTVKDLEELRKTVICFKKDFSDITPCGGSCKDCRYNRNGECTGCLKNGGRCVSMWQNGCRICACCDDHGVRFCGLCPEFPCEWLSGAIVKWDKFGLKRLGILRDVYIESGLDK